MDELKCRKRVLRRLGFATSSDVIEMKGRVACEISRYDAHLLMRRSQLFCTKAKKVLIFSTRACFWSVPWCSCVYSADELLLTEMMFNGLFNDLTAEQATALLSCFVFQENVRPTCRHALAEMWSRWNTREVNGLWQLWAPITCCVWLEMVMNAGNEVIQRPNFYLKKVCKEHAMVLQVN